MMGRTKGLGQRQKRVLRLLEELDGRSITAEDLGRRLHSARWAFCGRCACGVCRTEAHHAFHSRCEHCEREGEQVLERLVARRLVEPVGRYSPPEEYRLVRGRRRVAA